MLRLARVEGRAWTKDNSSNTVGFFWILMKLSPQTVEELKRARLIQEPAPLPWRDEELKHVVRALGIEEQKQARGFEEAPT